MALVDVRRAGAVFPGTALGALRLPPDLGFVVAEGRGAAVVSTDGRRFVDYVLSCGPMVLGHAHPAVTAAIAAQANRGTSFYYLNDRAVELAEKLVELVPCAAAVKFCNSGSEATFYALRIARAATGRTKILSFAGSYIGSHDYGLPTSAGVPSVLANQVVLAPFNDLEATRQIAEGIDDSLAAVIVEPVQRAIEPVPGFLAGLRALCDEIGALLVFDEVVTGLRVALGGMQVISGVTPDLCAFGKALGGGLGLGAVAGSRELIDHTEPAAVDALADTADKRVYMSGSSNGNPLACAAGLTTVAVLEEQGGGQALREAGAQLRAGLSAAAAQLSVQLQVIGPGPFIEPIIGDGRVVDHSSYLEQNRAASVAFGVEMIRRGVFVYPGQKMYLSTAHTDADIEFTVDQAAAALRSIRDRGLV